MLGTLDFYDVWPIFRVFFTLPKWFDLIMVDNKKRLSVGVWRWRVGSEDIVLLLFLCRTLMVFSSGDSSMLFDELDMNGVSNVYLPRYVQLSTKQHQCTQRFLQNSLKSDRTFLIGTPNPLFCRPHPEASLVHYIRKTFCSLSKSGRPAFFQASVTVPTAPCNMLPTLSTHPGCPTPFSPAALLIASAVHFGWLKNGLCPQSSRSTASILHAAIMASCAGGGIALSRVHSM